MTAERLAASPAEDGGDRRRSWLPAVVVIVVAVIGVALAQRRETLPEFAAQGAAVELPAVGELPAVTLGEFEGLIVGAAGKPVVVNVWASWCAPCRTEMPLLDSAARTYADRAVMLGVASKDSPQAAARFLDELGVSYPNVFDEDGSVRVALAVSAYPTTYVFDREGKLVARVAGVISEQRLAGLIEDVLR